MKTTNVLAWLYNNVILRYWQFRYRTTYLTVARLTLLVLAKEVTFPVLFVLLHVINFFLGSTSFTSLLNAIEPFFVPSLTEVLIGMMAVVVLGLTTWHEYYKAHLNDDYGCDIVTNEEQHLLRVSPTYKQIVYHPKTEEIKQQIRRTTDSFPTPITNLTQKLAPRPITPETVKMVLSKTNKSYVEVNLKFCNTGKASLFNCFVEISSDCSDVQFSHTNVEECYSVLAMPIHRCSNITVNEQKNSVMFKVEELNGGMQISIDTFYLYVPYGKTSFNLVWRANARGYQSEGILPVEVTPLFDKDYRQSHYGTTTVKYEDLIVDNLA